MGSRREELEQLIDTSDFSGYGTDALNDLIDGYNSRRESEIPDQMNEYERQKGNWQRGIRNRNRYIGNSVEWLLTKGIEVDYGFNPKRLGYRPVTTAGARRIRQMAKGKQPTISENLNKKLPQWVDEGHDFTLKVQALNRKISDLRDERELIDQLLPLLIEQKAENSKTDAEAHADSSRELAEQGKSFESIFQDAKGSAAGSVLKSDAEATAMRNKSRTKTIIIIAVVLTGLVILGSAVYIKLKNKNK